MPQVDEIATVVVCHRDDSTLEVLCEHLIADHFEVLPAPSGADALRLCRFNSPDILILDLSLPDMPGIDVLQEVREADEIESRIDPNLAIIVLLNREDGGSLARSRDLGADDYLSQLFAYGDLKTRIAAVLRRRHNRHDAPVRVGEPVVDPGGAHGRGRRSTGPPGEERVHRPRLRDRLRPPLPAGRHRPPRDIAGYGTRHCCAPSSPGPS